MNQSEKQEQIKTLITEIASNKEVTFRIKQRSGKSVNVGFINQYAKHDFLPNKWFDWERRIDAEIMIIGQDWGPYSALTPFLERYESENIKQDFNYEEFLFSTFSSRTEKFILKTIEQTYLDHFGKEISQEAWDNFFFTIAVFFMRQGNHFRGSEFYDEKFGVEHSLPYLRKQIEIVQPKVIIPLGGTAWAMIHKIFNLNKYPKLISKIIAELDGKPITAGTTTIIPIFHPASHTDPKIQTELWRSLWEAL